jgi:ribonuclease HI
LHRKVKEARTSSPLTHPGSIDTLIKTFGLGRTRVETVSPDTSSPYNQTRFGTKIAESRKAAREEARRDEPDFKIFTDGSDLDGGVGASAVMYRKGHLASVSQLKAYIGPSTKHNNYEAEIVGGILAMWLVTKTPDAHRKMVYVYTDNQPFIRSATRPKAAPGQYLLQNFNKEANNSQASITLKWISGHSKVRGNEKADSLAKEAALGRANRRDELPPILQKTLPTSISSKNKAHMDQLKEK